MPLIYKLFETVLVNIDAIVAASMLFTIAVVTFKNRTALSVFFVVLAVFSLLFLRGIVDWVCGLGGDSYIESFSFDIREAKFWASSFISIMGLIGLNPKIIAVTLTCTLALTCSSLVIVLKYKKAIYACACILVAAFSYVGMTTAEGFVGARKQVKEISAMFQRQSPLKTAKEKVDLFVYIGESTSTMNMHLYGYPLGTTPRLDALYRTEKNFFKFTDVHSTHTHTSESLLDAFSIIPDSQNPSRRIGIGNLLRSAGLRAEIYSAQSIHGSFASFSKYVFDGMDRQNDDKNRLMGNFAQETIKDHEVLARALASKGIVFFHSRAGHGDYLDNIQIELSSPIRLPSIGFHGIFGEKYSEKLQGSLRSDVESYDRAITYIDENVSRAMESVKSKKTPAAFIYFSDHGESPYTKRGHESSLFIDEMSTVPFVVYFNDAYASRYGRTVHDFSNSANKPFIRTLKQLTPTILDILQVESSTAITPPSIGSVRPDPNPVILKRKTAKGISSIRLDYRGNADLGGTGSTLGTAEPTFIYAIRHSVGEDNTICYHRADSYAKALRAANANLCLEVDMVVSGAGSLDIYHPPAAPTGLSLEHIFSIAESGRRSIWLDSKNINHKEQCATLSEYLKVNRSRVGKLLVEFPAETIESVAEIADCATKIRSYGAKTSYYVPTDLAISCSHDNSRCHELEQIISRAVESGAFSDLSFDFNGYSSISSIKVARKLKWNTWGVSVDSFSRIPRGRFDFIIIGTSNDPNTY
ncbi:sulfatase-like hydrolase/transferase [Niveibacterium terrae]|uniref:sulfatase-like hydrolase/transferase n=1 Tax=Niveibacterium terrae TaxID=3373598 RepID=UPI003A8E9193